MRFTTPLFATLVLGSFAGAAMAQEAVQDSTWITPSTQSRAEVRADTAAAARSHALDGSEASFTVKPSSGSGLTRAQVMAEAREAMRLGLIPMHDGDSRTPTAQEREQIRQAGQRAIDAGASLAAR